MVVVVCNVWTSKHSHSINADDVHVFRGLKKNLLGIFELMQFFMNNDKVLNCNATVNVGAASMYTNAVSAFSAGTGGKESDAVAAPSDFTVTSSNGEVDRNGSCAPSTSASTVRSEELLVLHSICSASVETAVSMEVGANFSTHPTDVRILREDVVKVLQSPKTRFNNSKAPDSTCQGMLTLMLLRVRIRQRLQVKVKAKQVAFSRILVEVNHLGVRNLMMVNQFCVSDQVEVKTMEK